MVAEQARVRVPRLRLSLGVVLGVLLIALGVPSNAAAAGYIAADHFTRNISAGWGKTSPGGSYTLAGPASDYWVSTATYARGLGYMRAPANAARGAMLNQARATNVQLGLSVYITGSAGDGPFYVYAVARSTNAGEVRAKIVYNRNCTVSMGGSVVAGGTERPIGSLATVPGSHWCGAGRTDRTMSLQMQVIGNTLRIRAWPSTATAPSGWLWSATSALPAAAGAVGLRTYVSSSAANGSTFGFYNWTAQAI